LERNKILWAHADELKIKLSERVDLYKERNEALAYVIEQLKVKLDVYEKEPEPGTITMIHEPSETPSVRWVTYSNYSQTVNQLHRQIGRLEEQDDGQ
jgi:hypothetical protein